MKLRSSGGRLQACRRGVVDAWRSGAREASCGPEDVAAKEVWRCAAGLGTLPQKRSGDASQSCRCGGVQVWSSGALEVRCRCIDVEA